PVDEEGGRRQRHAANVPRAKEAGTVPGGDCPINRLMGQSPVRGQSLRDSLAAVHAAPDRDGCDPVVADVLVALDLDPGQLVVVRPLQEMHELVLDGVAVVHADVLVLLLVDDLELERVVRHRATLTGVALTIALILAILFVPWPWNVLLILGGLAIETGELVWGLRLARRWKPKPGAEGMLGRGAGGVPARGPVRDVGVRAERW